MYNVEGAEWFLKNVDVRGKSVCELGNQRIWEHAARRLGIPHLVARDWMLDLGAIRYASIDTNGQDGAIRLDLSVRQLVTRLLPFDVITNVGTSEHVVGVPPWVSHESALRAQLHCFWNMFRLGKPGGLLVCQLPPVGKWQDHFVDDRASALVHYTSGFAGALARAVSGELLVNEEVYLPTLNPNESLYMFVIRSGKIAAGDFKSQFLVPEIEVKIL